jgi:hypothetical protein
MGFRETLFGLDGESEAVIGFCGGTDGGGGGSGNVGESPDIPEEMEDRISRLTSGESSGVAVDPPRSEVRRERGRLSRTILPQEKDSGRGPSVSRGLAADWRAPLLEQQEIVTSPRYAMRPYSFVMMKRPVCPVVTR